MRRTLLMSVAAVSLLAGSALAQTGGAQSPASPGSASQMPQPTNSLPAGASNPAQSTAGSTVQAAPTFVAPPTTVFVTPRSAPAVVSSPAPVAVAPVAPPPPMVTATPSPVVTATPSAVVTPGPVATAKPVKPMTRVAVNRRPRPVPADAGVASGDVAAPPTEAYRGGVGSPLSAQAANNAPSRPEALGSRLPEPGANSNSPEALLAAAQRDLNAGRTGAAQEGLERAQTRILSRTTDPSMSGQPDQAAMSMHIAAARRALGSRNIAAARAEIQAAMSAPVPPTGPAVTTTVTPQAPYMVVPGQPVMVPRSY